MLLLVVYIPAENLEAMKQALFAAGAGQVGDYRDCAWQTLGLGQFRPVLGANPTVGEVNSVTQIEEYRVEMVLQKKQKKAVQKALLQAHPYETPAYHFVSLCEGT
jgi:hypothetical protein